MKINAPPEKILVRLFYRFLLSKSYNIKLIIPKNITDYETKSEGLAL